MTLKKGGEQVKKVTMAGARVSAGLTQSDVAEKMGVSTPIVHYWETGKRPISAERFTEFCSIVGRSKSDIFLPKARN